MTKSINSKLEEIEKKFDLIKQLKTDLLKFTLDKNSDVRITSLEKFMLLSNEDLKNRVYAGLTDKEELVRITCLQIIESWKNEFDTKLILNALNDKSSLVRSYAAITLAMIGERKAIDPIMQRLNHSADEEKVRYYFALCKLGNNSFLELFLNGLFHEFYRIRCATADLMIDLANPTNKNFFLSLLKEIGKNEKTEAASSSIKSAIYHLQSLTSQSD